MELAQIGGASVGYTASLSKKNSAPTKPQVFSPGQHQGAICGLPLRSEEGFYLDVALRWMLVELLWLSSQKILCLTPNHLSAFFATRTDEQMTGTYMHRSCCRPR